MKLVKEYIEDIQLAILDAEDLEVPVNEQLEKVVSCIIADTLEWQEKIMQPSISYHRKRSDDLQRKHADLHYAKERDKY